MQQQGIDFIKKFAPVARFDTIWNVLAISANHKWNVYQFDVILGFLNGFWKKKKERVYVYQPLGYEFIGEESKVHGLKKGLYGLKQVYISRLFHIFK